jgi:acetylglutamate kinase
MDSEVEQVSIADTARILSEALPFMQRYDEEVVVVKYGGHAMVDPGLAKRFASDIVLLKQCGINPIVVHGGGPQINRMLDKLQVKSDFVDGLRVTDKATMEIVEMVLAGSINKSIVNSIQQAGGKAVGISGKDGKLLIAERMSRTRTDSETGETKILDFGFVGEPNSVNPGLLNTIIHSDAIPVVAPIGLGRDGETYNINADTVAGVLDSRKQLIEELTLEQVPKLIADGTITGGMIPKVESCVSVVEGGVEGVVIVDGRVPHCVLLELFTPHGIGTRISRTGE